MEAKNIEPGGRITIHSISPSTEISLPEYHSFFLCLLFSDKVVTCRLNGAVERDNTDNQTHSDSYERTLTCLTPTHRSPSGLSSLATLNQHKVSMGEYTKSFLRWWGIFPINGMLREREREREKAGDSVQVVLVMGSSRLSDMQSCMFERAVSPISLHP